MSYKDNTALQIDEDALTQELMKDLHDEAGKMTASPMEDNIQQLREKIKSARLEKLMASQLETEFVGTGQSRHENSDRPVVEVEDLYILPEEETPFEAPEPANSATWDKTIYRRSTTGLDSGTREHETNAFSNLNLSKSLQICERLHDEIAEHMAVYSRLAERTQTLRSQLGGFETDVHSLQMARSEYETLTGEHQRVLSALGETKTTVECQAKRIRHLEARVDSGTSMYEAVREELKKAKDNSNRKDQEIRSLKMQITSGSEEARQLKGKIKSLETSLVESETKTAESQKLAMEHLDTIENLTGENRALETEMKELREKLEEVQTRHDEFNRRGLEQQSHHYSKVHELEKTIRELRREVDLARQDKAQAITELKAANNLLALHEEMLETLSAGNA